MYAEFGRDLDTRLDLLDRIGLDHKRGMMTRRGRAFEWIPELLEQVTVRKHGFCTE